MGTETAPFRIELTPVGIRRIEIGPIENRIDITPQVSGVQVNSADGQPTTVIVRQNAGDAIIEGEGIIYVHKEKIDIGLILQMLNPAEIDEEALSRMGFDGETEKSLTEVIIEIIKEQIDAVGS